uniref:Uncharacterized protein n=1 Tax=Arundo donax TaxID=35708 RepID=A0A0A9BY56_ARUDO
MGQFSNNERPDVLGCKTMCISKLC